MTEIKFKPIGDRILIQADKAQEITPSGIHLTEKAREKPYTGTVKKVGNGDLGGLGMKEMTMKEGDRILYSRHAGTEITIEGVTYLIMRESEVLGIFEE